MAQHTGQQFDNVTQQYYLRARFYNPVIGRFTQEDEYRGDGLNLYAYCENNLVIYYDTNGYVCKRNTGHIKKYRDHGLAPQDAYIEAKKLSAWRKNKQRDINYRKFYFDLPKGRHRLKNVVELILKRVRQANHG